MAVLIFKQGNFTETGSLAYAEPIFFTDANTLIISGGVSTYANTEVSPQITAGRVDYRVATMDSINTGSFIVTSDVSASNLLLDGNATIRGNITMGGSGLDFGDASDDNVVFKADISSSIIPNDTGQFNLGSDSQRWRSLYLSGALDLQGGPIDLHSDTYISASSGTFTHLDVGSYLDVDVTGNTTFDGQGTLSVSSSGALKIDSPTSIGIGTNSDAPIDIDSTTLDIDSSGAITVDSTSTISLDGVGNSNFTIDSGNLTINNTTSGNMTLQSAGAIDIDADGGKITIDGSSGIDIGVESDVAIDIDSSTLDVDASGAITISGSGVFDVNAAGALTLDSDTSISIGTDNDKPIDIDSSTLDIDASGAITIDGTSTLSIDVDGATNINTSVGGIEINSEAGSLTLDGHTGVDIDASNSGKVTIDGAGGIDIGVAADVAIDVDSSTLDIDASGNITINGEGSTAISSSGALSVDSETGINIGTTTDKPIDIDASTLDIDASGALTIDSATSIGIGTNADKPIDIDSTTFDLDASGNITLDSATAINVGTVNSGVPISIGHTTSETTVNDNLTVTGNFTVNGTTTYVSSSNVTIGDRIIELNYLGASGNGGLYVGDADGTSTSGSLLWDTTNDNWIAGQKDLEHKILLENGDSIISGSGTNNQITTFTGTHGVDSSANLTFDGSILRITGTQEITSHLSGSASASFADLKISDDASIASLTVTDLTNDRVVIAGGGGEIEDSANLTFDGTTLGVTGNVSATVTGSFGRVIGSIGSTNGVVSGSSQVDYSGLSGINNDIVSASTDSSRVNFTITDGNITADLIGGVITGSSQVVLGDIPGFNTYTGSVDTEQSAQDTRLNQLASETGSITSEQAAQDTRLDQLSTETGSITSEQSAQDTRLNQLASATGSYLTSSGSVAFSDITSKPSYLVGSLIPGNNVTITSGSDTLKIEASGGGGAGTISGSSQVDHDATTNFVAGEHFLQSAITTVGTVTTGNVTAILPTGVLSGSLLPGSNVTINSSSDGFFISSSAAGGGANDATITLTAGSGLDGGGAFTVNQSGNEEITFTVSDGVVSGSSQLSGTFLSKLGDGVVSGSAQIDGSALGSNKTITISGTSVTLGGSISDETLFGGTGVVSGSAGVSKTLQNVTDAGASTNVATTFSNTTDSTSKTTGALIVGGGLGVNNTINAGGDVIAFASSDERLKDNIQPIENPLEKISQISGNTFDWNEEKQNIYNGKDYGVIAQEIQKVMPELVDTRDSGYLAVKYDKIVPLLIESIKELKREIEELKSK